MSKKTLGQYYTTNYKYILQNMTIPKNVTKIIEPFVGNGDLLNFFNKEQYEIECYDIEPKNKYTKKRDTIKFPPDYNGKFVITNPPYLARNKSVDKTYYDKYDVNDLYKCFIKELTTNIASGGIIIIPLNFFSSIRKNDIELRKLFFDTYDIIHINIFEERVFDDTSYTVCCFQFTKKNKKGAVNITFYPSKETIQTVFNSKNNYIIGGDIYRLETKNIYSVFRVTSKNITKWNTNILVKCIDDNSKNKICLRYVSDDGVYVDETPNQTARTYATLIIEPPLSESKQKILVKKFNSFLNDKRKLYHSLFLTNYRESNDIARKRISFDLVYLIVKYILESFQ